MREREKGGVGVTDDGLEEFVEFGGGGTRIEGGLEERRRDDVVVHVLEEVDAIVRELFMGLLMNHVIKL